MVCALRSSAESTPRSLYRSARNSMKMRAHLARRGSVAGEDGVNGCTRRFESGQYPLQPPRSQLFLDQPGRQNRQTRAGKDGIHESFLVIDPHPAAHAHAHRDAAPLFQKAPLVGAQVMREMQAIVSRQIMRMKR